MYHCEDCQVCTSENDHHCIFYSKCIAKGNTFSFYAAIVNLKNPQNLKNTDNPIIIRDRIENLELSSNVDGVLGIEQEEFDANRNYINEMICLSYRLISINIC